METIIVQIKNKKALELLKNLEDLKLIKLMKNEEETKMKPSDYFGTLSEEEGEKFQSYVSESRIG